MADTGPPERWVTIPQAAALLDKTERTIRRWVTDGDIPSQHVGRRLMVDVGARVAPETDPATLQKQVDLLRADVTHLQTLVDQLTGERDYLRSALAGALQLRQTAIEGPRRGWRWPWSKD